jgi:ribonuclease HI
VVLDPRAIHIHADGSCYKNPGGQSGCAAIVQYPEHLNWENERIVDFGCGESSNNRMELMACIKSLKWVRESMPWDDVTRVLILTDSTYVTENVNHAAEWKKKGWRNRHGQPIANDDLWDELLKARAKTGIRVDFIWQPGKKSVIAKEVDEIAKAAAQRGGIDVDRGYRPGGVSRSMVGGGAAAQPFPAAGQVVVVRPYVKKVMFRSEYRISFNVFDEIAQTYADKFFAFAGPLLTVELHMGNGHRVRFNSDPKYPQIVERIEGVALPKPPSRSKKNAQP